MRLRNALALGVTAATTGTAVLALAVAPSSADPGRGSGSGSEGRGKPPTCGKATDPDFPMDTRIHGGPGDYVPGEAFRTFELDLTNTTTEPCRGIHPVLALADRDRVLKPAQIQLDFYDSEARRWRPVRFEETEEDENIGVFGDFPGFAVPAGRTVTVSVRLAFRAGTAPNEVVANAAIVQRQGDDGDWVGESGDYRLTIAAEGAAGETDPTPEATTPPKGDTGLTRPELAHTGPESATTLAPASAALLLTGAALSLAACRRIRRG
ncbi:hypothetical protein [Streptomyces vilmorinianum]|uniref:hypothetical protein n=1 Tax=Streptomyces vilmorinianum TaxID=3051092 RepID=UPI0010FAEC33|nr:hypothetical protein [Streptomyces vilmorinianum]